MRSSFLPIATACLGLVLFSCSKPKEIDYGKLGYGNELFTDPQTKQPFTGIAREAYKDGKPKAEYSFKNGKFDGMVKEWWENGNPKAETEFKNGERVGKNTEWTAAGKLFHERVYDHDHIASEKNYDLGK
jgi:antitoxin component YwqK of YwqJK toxin-antitoxin module